MYCIRGTKADQSPFTGGREEAPTCCVPPVKLMKQPWNSFFNVWESHKHRKILKCRESLSLFNVSPRITQVFDLRKLCSWFMWTKSNNSQWFIKRFNIYPQLWSVVASFSSLFWFYSYLFLAVRGLINTLYTDSEHQIAESHSKQLAGKYNEAFGSQGARHVLQELVETKNWAKIWVNFWFILTRWPERQLQIKADVTLCLMNDISPSPDSKKIVSNKLLSIVEHLAVYIISEVGGDQKPSKICQCTLCICSWLQSMVPTVMLVSQLAGILLTFGKLRCSYVIFNNAA